MQGSEIFIPKLPSMSLSDLLKILGRKIKIKKIDIRPGEKLHEALIAKEDSGNTYEAKDYFLVLPSWRVKKINLKKEKLRKVSENFEYISNRNKKINKKVVLELFNRLKK